MALQETAEVMPRQEEPKLTVIEGGQTETQPSSTAYPEKIGGTTDREALKAQLAQIANEAQGTFTEEDSRTASYSPEEYDQAIGILSDESNLSDLKLVYTGKEIGDKGTELSVDVEELKSVISSNPKFVFFFTKGYLYQGDIKAGLAYASKQLGLGK